MKRVVIAGTSVYGIENQGDEALLSVLCRELHEAMPEVHLTLLARHPGPKLDEFFRVESIKNLEHDSKAQSLGRWFWGLNPNDSTEHLRKIWKAIEQCDLLIIGGDPFQEISLAFNRGLAPYAALLITLARFLQKPVMLYCIHMGRRLETPLGRELTRFCVTNADLVTLREGFSRDVLDQMGIPTANTAVLADAAFGLDPVLDTAPGWAILQREGIQFRSSRRVGINFRHHYWSWDEATWHHYRGLLAGLCDYMVEEFGAELLFIPNCTYNIDHRYEDDRPVADEIVAAMRNARAAHRIQGKYTLPQILSLFPLLDMHFSNRRHSLIFAAIHGVVPFASGGEWHIRPAMDELSIGDRFMRLEDFDLPLLQRRAQEIWGDRGSIRAGILAALPGLRRKAAEHGRMASELAGCPAARREAV